jgi:hypothetical protein
MPHDLGWEQEPESRWQHERKSATGLNRDFSAALTDLDVGTYFGQASMPSSD